LENGAPEPVRAKEILPARVFDFSGKIRSKRLTERRQSFKLTG